MFNDWALIESSFQADYGMDLMEELPVLTWRKFCVLLGGLSRNSALVSTLMARRREKKRIITNPEKAERAVDKVWA